MEIGSSVTNDYENDDHFWNYAPDSVLLHIFGYLKARDLLNVGPVCQLWWRISRDDIIWKHLFIRDYHINPNIQIMPGSLGWLDEYQRLHNDVPFVESECLDAHSHQVLHVSFSHNGKMFATTSKDGYIMVWNAAYPSSLKYQHNMKEFSWKYTQYSQFNCSDTLLLVSGVHFGSSLSTSGEIAVFTLQNEFLLQCRVVNKPYDVFGCWIGEHHLISGELHWLGHLTSSSILWINKASQEPDSEHTPIIAPLYRFYNANASSVRSVLISECKWFDEDSDHEFQTEVVIPITEPPSTLRENHQTPQLSIIYKEEYRIHQELLAESSEEISSESDSGSSSGPSDDDGLSNKLLIFTTGADTYIPHQIGFKRINKVEFPRRLSPGPSIRERLAARERERLREMDGAQPDWADFNSVKDKFNMPDKVIDLHGHIIGMGLSPDHKYLYVNSRPWPAGYQIQNPLEPPLVASHIDFHVIDLTSLTSIGNMMRSHKGYTPNADCYFIFLDVSDKYVASGAENRVAYIWDRYYGICLALLPHTDCVNAVAFNPANSHMCVTVCDDFSIRVWRSRSSTKELRIHGRGQPEGIAFRGINEIVTHMKTLCVAICTNDIGVSNEMLAEVLTVRHSTRAVEVETK